MIQQVITTSSSFTPMWKQNYWVPLRAPLLFPPSGFDIIVDIFAELIIKMKAQFTNYLDRLFNIDPQFVDGNYKFEFVSRANMIFVCGFDFESMLFMVDISIWGRYNASFNAQYYSVSSTGNTIQISEPSQYIKPLPNIIPLLFHINEPGNIVERLYDKICDIIENH